MRSKCRKQPWIPSNSSASNVSSRSSCALFSADHDWYHLRGIFSRDSAFDSRHAARDMHDLKAVSVDRAYDAQTTNTKLEARLRFPARAIASSRPNSTSHVLFHLFGSAVNKRVTQWMARFFVRAFAFHSRLIMIGTRSKIRNHPL